MKLTVLEDYLELGKTLEIWCRSGNKFLFWGFQNLKIHVSSLKIHVRFVKIQLYHQYRQNLDTMNSNWLFSQVWEDVFTGYVFLGVRDLKIHISIVKIHVSIIKIHVSIVKNLIITHVTWISTLLYEQVLVIWTSSRICFYRSSFFGGRCFQKYSLELVEISSPCSWC